MGYIPPPPPVIEETERYFRAVSGAAEALAALRELLAGEPDAAIVVPGGVIVEFTEITRFGDSQETWMCYACGQVVSNHSPLHLCAATGPTARLACRACGNALPPGAAFCIQCGAKV